MIKINFELESLEELKEVHDLLDNMEVHDEDFMQSFWNYGEKYNMHLTFGYEDLEEIIIERA